MSSKDVASIRVRSVGMWGSRAASVAQVRSREGGRRRFDINQIRFAKHTVVNVQTGRRDIIEFDELPVTRNKLKDTSG